MAARARREPPRRGVPFYDVERGRTMIVPRGGGRAVDYVGPREGFDARRALRKAGMAARDEARTSGGLARRGGAGLARTAGFDTAGWANALLWMFATLIMLGLLKAALEGRGPAGAERIFGWAGNAWARLFSPTDPLIGQGPATSTAASSPAAAGAAAGGAAAQHAGRLVPVPGNAATQSGVRLDAGIVSEAIAVTRRFGVKISSGFRDRAHNAEVGGAPNSDHLRGDAADFVGTPAQIKPLQAWAERQGFPYVEPTSLTHGTHVHISFARGGR